MPVCCRTALSAAYNIDSYQLRNAQIFLEISIILQIRPSFASLARFFAKGRTFFNVCAVSWSPVPLFSQLTSRKR
jgi:hypothetical protein